MKLLLIPYVLCTAAALPLDENLLDTEGSGSSESDYDSESTSNLALSVTDTISDTSKAHIMSQTFESTAGSFSHGFNSSDGTSVETVGEQRKIGDGIGTVMRGSYFYIAPNGQKMKITWVADETGFKAFGPLVPEAPAYLSKMMPTSQSTSDGGLKKEEADMMFDRLDEEELLVRSAQSGATSAAAEAVGIEDKIAAAVEPVDVEDEAPAAVGALAENNSDFEASAADAADIPAEISAAAEVTAATGEVYSEEVTTENKSPDRVLTFEEVLLAGPASAI